MYTPINQYGIVGMTQINGNGIYPLTYMEKDIWNENHQVICVQDAKYPLDMVLFGRCMYDKTLYYQEITFDNLNQYRYVRDNFSRYCSICNINAYHMDVVKKIGYQYNFVTDKHYKKL